RKISKLLRNQMFHVIEADDGVDALSKLSHDPDIRVVITDYNMPNMDGVELTLEIRKHYSKDQLAVIAISSEESELISSRFLKFGASDFIKKPFSNEEFNCRINNTIESLEQIETIQDMQNKDYMTKTYNRTYFFQTMGERFKEILEEEKKIAVAMINIDGLKEIWQKYGQKTSDKAIKAVAKRLLDETKGSDMVSRFGSDEFCVAVQGVDKEKAFDFFDTLRFDIHSMDLDIAEEESIHFTVSIGISASLEDSIEKMVNEADLQLYKAKQNKNTTSIA
ncbi:MAG: diguanylate cyclase, partial [Campylobacterota bacterium]